MANVHSSACSGPARAAWILLFVTCGISAVPFVGFGAWLIAGPVLLTTFILSIIVLSRGGTVQGLNLLVMTIIGAPLFISIAPVISSLVGLGSASSHTYPTSPTPIRSSAPTESPLATPAPSPATEKPDFPRAIAVQRLLGTDVASATPSATYRVIKISKGDYLNVRAGAGSNYPIVKKLESGTGDIVLGAKRVANGETMWQEIIVNGRTGWVNADYLDLATQPSATGQNFVAIRPLKRTYIKVIEDNKNSNPAFERWISPTDGTLEFRGHHISVRVLDRDALQIKKNGTLLVEGDPDVTIGGG